jgi:hypothetical protein
MKNTALTHLHESLGAKMLPFAGYNMPILYEGVNAEHETVRHGVGVFDVSHMGEFLLTGDNALALIQKVTSNDASTLTIGRAQYSCLPNKDGGIVDDLIVYRIEGLGKNLIPTATDFDVIDKFMKVTDEESAHVTREIAKKEGLFVGYTSGAVMQAIRQYAEEGEFTADSNVIAIFPDHGSRYMSKVFSDEWMNDQGFFDSVNAEEVQKIEFIK